MGRDDYPVTIILELYLLIHTEGGIQGNQKSSTYENRGGGRGGLQKKERMGHTFNKEKGGTEGNATLVPGKDGKTLNATCYNCCKPGHLAYN